MASTLYYLVGPPGSGKRTIGTYLEQLTGAVLLDNHLWNDPVFKAFGADGVRPVPPEIFALSAQVRQAGLAALRLAPPDRSHILTNYLTARESGREVLENVRGLAAVRGAIFVPVWLSCDLEELARRMPLPERAERLKLRDAGGLRRLLEEGGIQPPPPDAVHIDTVKLTPADAALLIASHAGALF